MRFNVILILIFVSSLITSCINQNPAPVEYSSSIAPTNTIPNYYGVPQNIKTQEDTITSQELIVNEPAKKEYKNLNQEQISYEDKIKSLDDSAEEKSNKETIVDDEIEKELSQIQKEIKKQDNAEQEQNKKNNKIISEIENNIALKESSDLEKSIKPKTPPLTPSFIRPVNGKLESRHEDIVNGKKIKGIYVSSNDGVVKSSNSGEVLYSGYDNDFGNLIIIKSILDKDEVLIAYANLSSLKVNKGDIIKQGELIGNVEIGKKVHIAFRKNKQVVDPLEYLGYCT